MLLSMLSEVIVTLSSYILLSMLSEVIVVLLRDRHITKHLEVGAVYIRKKY